MSPRSRSGTYGHALRSLCVCCMQTHLSVPVVHVCGLESTQRRTTRAGAIQGPQRWISSTSNLD